MALRPTWAWTALAVLMAACGTGSDEAPRTGARTVLASDASRGAGGSAARGPSCALFERVASFTSALRETSGLARSGRSDSILWTHNDSGGDPELSAIGMAGRLRASVTVTGARNRDWEALSAGPCPEGACLFVGDIGDNLNERDPVTVYRVPEPELGDTRVRARAWAVRYPGGPRDAEGLAVHPMTGTVWIVSKGRAHPAQVFRIPLAEDADSALAEPVVNLTDGPLPPPSMLTGAAFTPDGRWLLVRSYVQLFFLPVDADGVPGPPVSEPVDLSPLGERQGEAVETFPDGWVYFTSEAAMAGARPELARARCDYPEAGTEGAP